MSEGWIWIPEGKWKDLFGSHQICLNAMGGQYNALISPYFAPTAVQVDFEFPGIRFQYIDDEEEVAGPYNDDIRLFIGRYTNKLLRISLTQMEKIDNLGRLTDGFIAEHPGMDLHVRAILNVLRWYFGREPVKEEIKI